MNEEELNRGNDHSLEDPHSPNEQVKCLLCQTIPEQYISLDCKDDFCLICLSQKFYIMKQNNEIVIIDGNNCEIPCPICKCPTLLDEVSINALEETLNLMNNEIKRKDLFNEIIMEDSAENYNYEESLKVEERKSNDNNYSNNINFLSPNNFINNFEEQKDKEMQNFEHEPIIKTPKEKEKNFQKAKKNYVNPLKLPELDMNKILINDKSSNENLIEKKEKKTPHNEPEHSNVKSEYSFKNKDPKCLKHKNETTNLFCFSCETNCLCVECLVEGSHKNHNVKSVTKGFQLLSEKIASLNEKINQKTFQNKDLVSFLEQEKKTFSNLNEANKENLKNKFKEIKAAIQKKEQETLKEYEKQGAEKIKNIDKLIRNIEKNKEILANLQNHSNFEKFSIENQVAFFNNYSENVQKLSKFFEKKKSSSDPNLYEISFHNDYNALNLLLKSIESFPKDSVILKEANEEIEQNNFNNRKIRMESEYLNDLPISLDNNNFRVNTQSSSFLGSPLDFKLPTRRQEKGLKNSFKNSIFNTDKNSKVFRFKDVKLKDDVFRVSTKGWSKTPTPTNQNILERQQKKFERQKEFFFSKF